MGHWQDMLILTDNTILEPLLQQVIEMFLFHSQRRKKLYK